MQNKKRKMYVTGDTHGEEARMVYAGYPYNRDLGEGDILFILGDFGYISNDGYKEHMFLKYLAEEKPYTICFIDGNHENFDVLESFPVEEWNGGKVHVIRRDQAKNPKIIHLMRGQVYEIDGKKIFTFGGGYSLDRYMRREGYSWWAREMPSQEEMDEGLRNLERVGFKVDYILTHTAPMDTMARYKHYHPDERPLNNYLEYIREKTTYEHWYMGHLHLEEHLWRNQTILWFNVCDMDSGEWVDEM